MGWGNGADEFGKIAGHEGFLISHAKELGLCLVVKGKLSEGDTIRISFRTITLAAMWRLD